MSAPPRERPDPPASERPALAGLDEHPDPPSSARVRAGKARLLSRIAEVSAHSADDESLIEGGRYRIGEVLARGGLGVIRRAYDRHLGRYVAMKELRDQGAEAERRFLIESTITARLEHPGIIPIHDVGRHPDGAPFYCMRLVEGETLDEAIRARAGLRGRLSLVERVLAVADAVAHAHRQGVVHRDLKPANVIIGEYGETVVIDWGLARELRGELAAAPPLERADAGSLGALATEAGTIVGTLRYMAPEQARGEEADPRADVFALGGLLFHILAGRPPYPDLDRTELIRRARAGATDDLRALAPEAPRALVAIVARATAARREDRYSDGAAFADDLRRFLTGRLVGAHHYSLGELGQMWARRHRAAVVVAAFASLVVVALSVLFVRGVGEERARALSAETEARAAEAEARRRADTATLARARLALERDPVLALVSLGASEVDLAEDENLQEARRLAIAAVRRGLPEALLRGHVQPIRGFASLADGGLVSVDIGGAVWRWDLERGTGDQVLDLAAPDVVLVAAADAPVWVALSRESGYVIRGDALPERIALPLFDRLGALELSRDGAHLLAEEIAGPRERAFHVLDLSGAATPPRSFSGRRASLAPDGAAIAVQDAEGGIRLISGEGERSLSGIRIGRGFSASGEYLVGAASTEGVALSMISGALRPIGGAIAALTRDDHALVHEIDPGRLPLSHSYRFALRSLVTGEDRWHVTLDGFAPREVIAATWGGGSLALDERGERFALALDGRWYVHSLRDGSVERVIEGGPIGAFVGAGRSLAVASGAEIRVWDAVERGARSSLLGLALAPDGSYAVGHGAEGPSLLGPDGAAIRLDSGAPDIAWKRAFADVVVDSRGRVLSRSGDGELSLVDAEGATHSLLTESDASALALADGSDDFAVGSASGELRWYATIAAAPSRWRFTGGITGLWLAGDGATAYARVSGGEIVALERGEEPEFLVAANGRASERVAGVLHPTRGAAFILTDRDLVVSHDAPGRVVLRPSLGLAETPVAAFSPSGRRLALAVGGPAIRVLTEGDDHPTDRVIATPASLSALVFVDEDRLLATGDDDSLIGIDLVRAESLLLRRAWLPAGARRISLAARPGGGALAVSTRGLRRLPAHRVPSEADAFREWLLDRARPLRGGGPSVGDGPP